MRNSQFHPLHSHVINDHDADIPSPKGSYCGIGLAAGRLEDDFNVYVSMILKDSKC